jgi:hypothetical protein
MTAPAMPRNLAPLISGYASEAPAGAMRTEVEGGPARYGLAYDRGTQVFSVSMMLSPLRFSVWNTFYIKSIKLGTVSFTMELDSGYGAADHTVNIVPGSYSSSRSGTFTFVGFQVEATNKAHDLSDADAAALLALYEEAGDGSDLLLARIAQFANVDSNALDF